MAQVLLPTYHVFDVVYVHWPSRPLCACLQVCHRGRASARCNSLLGQKAAALLLPGCT